MNFRHAILFVGMFGRDGARAFYVVLGIILIVMAPAVAWNRYWTNGVQHAYNVGMMNKTLKIHRAYKALNAL